MSLFLTFSPCLFRLFVRLNEYHVLLQFNLNLLKYIPMYVSGMVSHIRVEIISYIRIGLYRPFEDRPAVELSIRNECQSCFVHGLGKHTSLKVRIDGNSLTD